MTMFPTPVEMVLFVIVATLTKLDGFMMITPLDPVAQTVKAKIVEERVLFVIEIDPTKALAVLTNAKVPKDKEPPAKSEE
jgi:hypothetical protein